MSLPDNKEREATQHIHSASGTAKRILVLGGTQYFGKRLVQILIDQGHEVTIATRGQTPDPFGEHVKRVSVDRTSLESMRKAFSGQTWDIVYDNICYSPDEALVGCEVFSGKVGQYVLTSTLVVYELDGKLHGEDDFNPRLYPLKTGSQSAFWYGEAKRLAEAAFFQKAPFPVCAVRFPIVLGTDDYTRRLHFHIERIKNGQTIGIPNPTAAMNYITSAEAASFLAWLADCFMEGPVNAASKGALSLNDMITLIEQTVGQKAHIQSHTVDADMSPFGVPRSWLLDTTHVEKAGFRFSDIMDWFPQLVREIAAKG